jgi:uncharacterized membrane protein (TIGR02234 family)
VTPGRVRALALSAPALTALVAMLAWTQPWIIASIGNDVEVHAAGDIAAPALPALALSSLALVAALALAGPVFRVILGVLLMLISIAIITSGVIALVDPIGAVTAAVTAVSGIEGDASVRESVEAASVTVWPSIAMVAGAGGAVGGLFIILTSRRWPTRVRKYDALRTESTDQAGSETGVRAEPLDAWDALSDGRDPTAG